MVIGPLAAQKCIRRFTGRVLYIPSSYLQDSDTAFPAPGLSAWEVSPINLFKYYLQAFVSLRALSTILLLTEVTEARDLDDDFESSLFNLTPDTRMPPRGLMRKFPAKPHSEADGFSNDTRILEYLASDSKGGGHVKLVRRFEYKFHLCGSRVVSLHYKTVGRAGEPLRDERGSEVLHLVEVYENGWGAYLVRAFAVAGLIGLSASLLKK